MGEPKQARETALNERRRWNMADREHDQKVAHRRSLASKLETAGWGLFFIWVGIALLADIGWGAGLFGVGIITLGAQAARKYLGLKPEGFWVGVGFLFIVGGVWELFHVQVGLMPILCVVLGLALSVFTLVGRPRDESV